MDKAMSEIKLGECCEHGNLKRQCLTCELLDEIDQLKTELEDERKYTRKLLDQRDEAIAERDVFKAQLAKADRWQGTEFPVKYTLRDMVITIDREK